jgi:hypothetical protein
MSSLVLGSTDHTHTVCIGRGSQRVLAVTRCITRVLARFKELTRASGFVRWHVCHPADCNEYNRAAHLRMGLLALWGAG